MVIFVAYMLIVLYIIVTSTHLYVYGVYRLTDVYRLIVVYIALLLFYMSIMYIS